MAEKIAVIFTEFAIQIIQSIDGIMNLTKECDCMKNLLAFILTLGCMLGLFGCSQKYEEQQNGNKLTLDMVVELSVKGEELTWSDFKQYESTETGSGLYILVYEIDETFDLWIGGGTLDDTPMYIRLVTKANIDNCIDIRTGDVKAFIEANEK